MTNVLWRVTEAAAQLLERDEGEAVLGDLSEADEGAWPGLLDVLGLVVRQQLLLWKGWRPWLVTFGLALPASLHLMGISLVVSSNCIGLIDHGILSLSSQTIDAEFLQFLCRGLLLFGCSWAGGFVMGSMSRGTLWASIASSCCACLFCLMRFREPSLSRLCLLLFLPPAIWASRQGLRFVRIHLVFAVFLAIAITTVLLLSSNNGSFWALNWSLVWPAWYIVTTARGDSRKVRRNEETTA